MNPSQVLPNFRLKGKDLLPVVQGGMGVGVSAHLLAGHVARLGAMGTISSIDLRRHHADLMQQTGRCRNRELIEAANLEALDREIKAARAISGDSGFIAVNVMRAVNQYKAYVQQSCISGADAIVMGAGLPLDLPELTSDWPSISLVPILSDARGIAILLKKWTRKNRLPDAIIIEHPAYAGGHLGSPNMENLDDPRFGFKQVIEETLELFEKMGLASASIPLIVAGGIYRHEQIRTYLQMGASAVQLGTAFAVTIEGDAHPQFKKVLAEAKPEDIVTFMSVAGLPARAVRTPWLENYLRREDKLRKLAHPLRGRCTLGWDCLIQCGLRDGDPKAGQFCIDHQLAAAMNGDLQKGLFFRGSEPLPFGSAIRPVVELMRFLLTGKDSCKLSSGLAGQADIQAGS
ncbi:MAG TPA: nitronate monooxygenase family protein [Burkholderiales bacterium]|nr:nitronate monooxygenase family protein [Burkholderiales bacterium]